MTNKLKKDTIFRFRLTRRTKRRLKILTDFLGVRFSSRVIIHLIIKEWKKMQAIQRKRAKEQARIKQKEKDELIKRAFESLALRYEILDEIDRKKQMSCSNTSPYL